MQANILMDYNIERSELMVKRKRWTNLDYGELNCVSSVFL